MVRPSATPRPLLPGHGLSARRRPTPGRRCASPVGQRWLQADGSLTARLGDLGAVRVSKLRQGHQAFWPAERRVLGASHGHVREVLLWVDERPAVWARSLVCAQGVKGAWRALRGLGNRPLAELLFTDRAVRRTPLNAARLRRHSLQDSHLQRHWPHAKAGRAQGPSWLRWSVFTRRGQALLVQEAFAPWVLASPMRVTAR